MVQTLWYRHEAFQTPCGRRLFDRPFKVRCRDYCKIVQEPPCLVGHVDITVCSVWVGYSLLRRHSAVSSRALTHSLTPVHAEFTAQPDHIAHCISVRSDMSIALQWARTPIASSGHRKSAFHTASQLATSRARKAKQRACICIRRPTCASPACAMATGHTRKLLTIARQWSKQRIRRRRGVALQSGSAPPVSLSGRPTAAPRASVMWVQHMEGAVELKQALDGG